MPDPALLSVTDRTFADCLALHHGDEDLALRTFIREEARREANEKVQRNAILDAERDGLTVYLDLGPISDMALKCQRMDYSYALIRSPAFRASIEARVFGGGRAAESYVPAQGAAA